MLFTKVNSITTDNAPNMTKATREINDSEDDLLNIKPIRCACHIINQIVQAAFEEESMNKSNQKIRYYC